MNTREKILEAALKLFNEKGTETITVRHIAKEIGISHGNLCYHFPNTDEIIFKLYENLVEELSIGISRLPVKEVDLWLLYRTGHLTFSLMYKYKFLMLDFVGIMRRIEKLKNHYRQLVIFRQQEFQRTMEFLIVGGYLKPEVTQGHYAGVREINFILGDFWISRAEIIFEGPEKEKLNYYLSLMFIPVLGSLTEKGLAQYEEIRRKVEEE
jgi:AcrR family transcriptional regulator